MNTGKCIKFKQLNIAPVNSEYILKIEICMLD